MITKADKIYNISNSTGTKWRVAKGVEPICGTDDTITSSLLDIVELPIDVLPNNCSEAQVKSILDGFVLASELNQDEIEAITSLYPTWESGVLYSIDDIVSYGNTLYRVVQAHTSQSDWTPDAVSSLFTVTYTKDVIPDWVQPTGAQDAYNIGDKVMFDGAVYESLIAANVWSPATYPAGWILVE